MVNVNLLKAETVKRGYKDRDVANALNISVQAYNKKLRKETKFTVNDAFIICRFLDIVEPSLKADIFLT